VNNNSDENNYNNNISDVGLGENIEFWSGNQKGRCSWEILSQL
jgi:hypothetical protein